MTIQEQSGLISELTTLEKPELSFSGSTGLSTNPEVLLFGHTGRLGREILKVYGENCQTVDRRDCDFTDADSVKAIVRKSKAKTVINAVAMNGIETCEYTPDDAYKINAETPLAIANACTDTGALFVHYSTDYTVFGSGDRLKEKDDAINNTISGMIPLLGDAYSLSKYRAESLIGKSRARHLILRLSSIYSTDTLEGPLGPVKQYMEEGKGTKENPIKVLKQFCTPTSTVLIAQKTRQILHKLDTVNFLHQSGGMTFNLVCNGPEWKRTFAWHALWLFAPGASLQKVEIKEGELRMPRPVFSALSPMKLHARLGIRMPSVMEDLEEAAKRWGLEQKMKVTVH